MWLMGMKTENLLEGLVSISNVYQEIAGDTVSKTVLRRGVYALIFDPFKPRLIA
jgi:hypothetical protein